jgi:drug/metabolite transporter (DMT)-like permease
MVLVDILMLLSGEAMAPLLTRLYYNSGGRSMWMATLAQSAGWPLLLVPLLLTPPPASAEQEPRPAAAGKVAAVCVGLGLLIGCSNLMYSYAMLYLPVSTFSLVAATQLAFSAVTSRLVNARRLTALVLNSVIVLTFSAALLAVGSDSDSDSDDGGGGGAGASGAKKRALGFVMTLSASAVHALILSLLEVTFEKVIRARTLRWVLTVEIITKAVATAMAAAALLASGQWRAIPGEAAAFEHGAAAYVATLAGVAVAWEAAALGTVRLVARASSLFANVTGTLALPLVPVFAVAMFGDRMTGVKVVAMLMAVWGFLSYVYQHYLDDRRAAKRKGRSQAQAVVPALDNVASQRVLERM